MASDLRSILASRARLAACLLIGLAGVISLVCCARALALPAAPGLQVGRPIGAAFSGVPRARQASLACTLGTPVIGPTLPKAPCEAAEKLAGKAVGGLVGEAVSAAGGGVMSALAEWMIAAASTVTRLLARELRQTSTPQLGAAWFQGQFAPMADLGAALGLLVALIALASAAVRRDPSALAASLAGIVRAGIGTGLVVALNTLGLEIADQISNAILAGAPHSFWNTVAHAWGTSGFGGFESSALATLIALVEVLAAIFVLLELIVRDAGLYVAVLFFPVVLAASIWPALSSWTGRLARIELLLIVLKPVALIVLCLGGSAAAAGLSFSGGISGSVGTILVAIVIFALAAFAPWVLMYLLAADAEAAHAGLGLRAGAGAAVAGGQGRSLRNLGGLRDPSSSLSSSAGGASPRAGGGGPGGAPGGGPGGRGPSGRGGGPGGRRGGHGYGGGSASSPGAPSAAAHTPGEQDTLPLDGAAVGAGSLGAAAGHSPPTGEQAEVQPRAEASQPGGGAAPQGSGQAGGVAPASPKLSGDAGKETDQQDPADRPAAPQMPAEDSPRPAAGGRVLPLPARSSHPRPAGRRRSRSEVPRTPKPKPGAER